MPEVSFTPIPKSDLPYLQLQLALEHVRDNDVFHNSSTLLYTDGSLQADDAAGGAVFSPDLEPPLESWVDRRLRDHSSFIGLWESSCVLKYNCW